MTDLSKRLRGLPAWTTLKQAADEIDKLEAEIEMLRVVPLGAVKAERERCAKIAENFSTANTYDLATGRHEIAAAIRGTDND